MRKYGKVDANQTEIVRQLRLLGCSVVSTANISNGFPDIVVYNQHGEVRCVNMARLTLTKRRL